MGEQINYDIVILKALERATTQIEPLSNNKAPLITKVDGEWNKDGNGVDITVTFRNGAKVLFNPNNIIKEPDEEPLTIGQQMVKQMFVKVDAIK